MTANELGVDLQIVVRRAADARLASQHMHDLRRPVDADQQARGPLRHRLVGTAHRRIQPLHALLDLADEHGAVGRLSLEALDQRFLLGQSGARLIDPDMPFVVGPLELIDARDPGTQIRFQSMDGLLSHAQIGLDLLGARDAAVGVRLQRPHGLLLLDDAGLELLDPLFAGGNPGNVIAALRHRLAQRGAPLVHFRPHGGQLGFELVGPLALLGCGGLELLAAAARSARRLFLFVAQRGGGRNRGFQRKHAGAQLLPLPGNARKLAIPSEGCFRLPCGRHFQPVNEVCSAGNGLIQRSDAAAQLLTGGLRLAELLVALREGCGECVDLLLECGDALRPLSQIGLELGDSGGTLRQIVLETGDPRGSPVQFGLHAGEHVVEETALAFLRLQRLEVARRARMGLSELDLYARQDALVFGVPLRELLVPGAQRIG